MSSLFPEFMRKRVEQEIEDAIHPKGMSTHNGRTRILAADAQRMLQVLDLLLEKTSLPEAGTLAAPITQKPGESGVEQSAVTGSVSV